MPLYQDNHPPLFTKHDLRARLEDDLAAALKAALVLPREQFAGHSDEVLVEEVLAEFLQPLQVDIDQWTLEEREIDSVQLDGSGTMIFYDIYVPFRGQSALLLCKPSRPLRTILYGDVTDSAVVLTFLPQRENEMKAEIEEEVAVLARWADAVNADIAKMTTRAEAEVLAKISRRRKQFDKSQSLIAALDLPIRSVPSRDAVEFPVTPRRVVPEPATAAAGAGEQEWRLQDAIYEQIVTTITRFTHAMERRPASTRALLPATKKRQEETLRDWLIFLLNANYEIDGAGEVFIGGETLNGNGKTDILVRHDHGNVFIGECKFWGGETAFPLPSTSC